MRIMGLDYGDKTLGIAVSDPFGWTAQGVEVIRRKDSKNLKETIQRIKTLVDYYEIQTIVLGFPKNMNNTEGERCKKTLYFKKKLDNEFPLIEILLIDERMSTISAEKALLEADLSRSKRKKLIDKMSAVVILQEYLDTVTKKL